MGYTYMVKCNVTGSVYYGSSKNIKRRMYNHKTNPGKYIKNIIENGNFDVIILYIGDGYIETENYFIKNFPCVNHNIVKVHDVRERQKFYRTRYSQNILNYKRKLFICDCGCHMQNHHKYNHFKTKKHQTLVLKS